jgi:hypothetical protein
MRARFKTMPVTTMHVTRTKRLVERDVNVPNYLIPDLQAYIDGERKECIAVGRRYWIKKKSDEPKALFQHENIRTLTN